MLSNDDVVNRIDSIINEVVLPVAKRAAEEAAREIVVDAVKHVLSGWTEMEIRQLIREVVKERVNVELSLRDE